MKEVIRGDETSHRTLKLTAVFGENECFCPQSLLQAARFEFISAFWASAALPKKSHR
jgi:hypothetical protein